MNETISKHLSKILMQGSNALILSPRYSIKLAVVIAYSNTVMLSQSSLHKGANSTGVMCITEYVDSRTASFYSDSTSDTLNLINENQLQDGWLQKANCGSSGCFRVGFSIGNKGYIGTGMSDFCITFPTDDFWEYDPGTDVWTAKAKFAGSARNYAAGFTIGTKGYIGFGADNFGIQKDLWEWDQTKDAWTKKANFPGSPKSKPVGFSIGGKGYIGVGSDTSYMPTADFWSFDTLTNSWTKKADFGGGPRTLSIGFSIGNKGYIGLGEKSGSIKSDFWEYDPTTDQWTQKADYPGGPRNYAVGFSMMNKGYVGTGSGNSGLTNDFWEYNPTTDTWTQKANYAFAAAFRITATGFSIGGKGYIGTGCGANADCLTDFWEYDTLLTAVNEKHFKKEKVVVYPNPASNELYVQHPLDNNGNATFIFMDVTGKIISSTILLNDNKRIHIETKNLPSGLYFYQTIYAEGITDKGKIIIAHSK